MLWILRKLGNPIVSSFGLAQLAFSLKLNEKVTAFGGMFATTGLPVSEFVQHLPLNRRNGISVFKNLLSSCIVANVFLPGNLSTSTATLINDNFLRIQGGFSEEVPGMMLFIKRRLRKVFGKLGAILLPMSFTVGGVGGDIHYAGSLPMKLSPKIGETDFRGEVFGLEGVHVVDGACLPILTEKSHTLTIMANADRIGRELVMYFKNKNF